MLRNLCKPVKKSNMRVAFSSWSVCFQLSSDINSQHYRNDILVKIKNSVSHTANSHNHHENVFTLDYNMFQRSYRCANQQVFFISWTRWAVRWNFSSERTPSGFEVPPSFKIVDSWRCSVLVVGLVTTILQRINWLVKSVQSRLFEYFQNRHKVQRVQNKYRPANLGYA